MVGPVLDCSGNAFWLGCDADYVSTGDADEPVVCVNGSLLFLFSGEAPREADRELIANTRPILWRHRPLSRDLTCD